MSNEYVACGFFAELATRSVEGESGRFHLGWSRGRTSRWLKVDAHESHGAVQNANVGNQNWTVLNRIWTVILISIGFDYRYLKLNGHLEWTRVALSTFIRNPMSLNSAVGWKISSIWYEILLILASCPILTS